MKEGEVGWTTFEKRLRMKPPNIIPCADKKGQPSHEASSMNARNLKPHGSVLRPCMHQHTAAKVVAAWIATMGTSRDKKLKGVRNDVAAAERR